MSIASKPTMKDLRAEVQRLGITADSAGCPIDELLRTARDNDDPLGFLAIHAPADREAESAEYDPIGDVPAPLPEPPAVADVSVSVPLADFRDERCYISRHVEVRLSRQQGIALRRLQLALDARGERLAGGRRVIHAADALKWLLDQLCSSMS